MKKAYYTTEQVTDHITAIWSGCREVLYFIEGGQRGLLMDTNLGAGHLKDVVDALADKPYDVVVTHGHLDHALGAPEFERVYMNRKDIPLYKAMTPMSERLAYLKGSLGPAYEEFGFTEEDFVPPKPDKLFLDLEEGDSFDLGGVHVEIVAFPGHTSGSVALLIPEERILITGDACNNATFLFDDDSLTVEEYRQEVLRVKKLVSGAYDRVLVCHHAIDGGEALLDEVLEVCDDIMAGNVDDLPFSFRGYDAYIAKKCNQMFQREDGKCGNLVYNKHKIFKRSAPDV